MINEFDKLFMGSRQTESSIVLAEALKFAERGKEISGPLDDQAVYFDTIVDLLERSFDLLDSEFTRAYDDGYEEAALQVKEALAFLVPK